tara:strand:- start:1627 stop:2442 length:816 start_codon:yes stop_codon:yes gene_type:complete
MNQRIWINILLCFVVFLLSIFTIFDNENIKEDPSFLSTIDPNKISKIEIERKNLESLSFSKKNGEWEINSPLKIQANSKRIKSILNLLTTKSYKKLNLNEVDIAQFNLRSPEVILKLDQNNFLFGTTHPIDQKRYVLFNEIIHLIDDYLFHQLMVNVYFFADVKLLPKNLDIISIVSQKNKLQKNNNKWTSSVKKYNEEKIISIVSKWENAIALSVGEYKENENLETISIHALSGEKIDFTIMENESYLILGRKDIGIQYTLSRDDAMEMF